MSTSTRPLAEVRGPGSHLIRLTAVLAVGTLAGAWAALDPVLSYRVDWKAGGRAPLRLVPYAVTLGLAAGVVVMALLFRHRERLWQERLSVAIAFVMFGSQLIAVGSGPLNPLTLAIFLLLAVWLVDRLARPAAPWKVSGFGILIGLLLACVLWSALGRASGEVLSGVLSTVPKLILALLLISVIDSSARLGRAVSAMLWATGLAAVVGILQVVVYYFWNTEYTLVDQEYRYVSGSGWRLLRASGFSNTANQFAAPLAVAALVSVYLAFSSGRRARRAGWFLLSALLAAAVGLSVARGSWVALAVGLCAAPVVARPRRAPQWIGAIFLLVAAGMATGALPSALRRLDEMSESGMVERKLLVQAGWRALMEHPWSGVGIYNFGSFSPSYERYPVHNALLQAGSELGMPGMIVLVVLHGWVVARLVAGIGGASSTVQRSLLGALLVGDVALLVVMQGEPMAYSQFAMIYAALGEAASRIALAPASG